MVAWLEGPGVDFVSPVMLDERGIFGGKGGLWSVDWVN